MVGSMTQLPPGLDLEALVAPLLGWTKLRRVDPDFTGGPLGFRGIALGGLYGIREGGAKDMHGNPAEEMVPQFSRDIAAAWQVVDKLGEDPGEFTFELYRLASGAYVANFVYEESGGPDRPVGLTAPHAICLAALRAGEALVGSDDR